MQAARNAGVRVLLNFVDILSPNETELARLTGLPTESFEEITQAALKCHEMVSFIHNFCEQGFKIAVVVSLLSLIL